MRYGSAWRRAPRCDRRGPLARRRPLGSDCRRSRRVDTTPCPRLRRAGRRSTSASRRHSAAPTDTDTAPCRRRGRTRRLALEFPRVNALNVNLDRSAGALTIAKEPVRLGEIRSSTRSSTQEPARDAGSRRRIKRRRLPTLEPTLNGGELVVNVNERVVDEHLKYLVARLGKPGEVLVDARANDRVCEQTKRLCPVCVSRGERGFACVELAISEVMVDKRELPIVEPVGIRRSFLFFFGLSAHLPNLSRHKQKSDAMRPNVTL